MAELKLSQMPLLEYNLRRYAINFAKRLGLAEDVVLENWDKWIDRELTYIENKERVKRALLNMAKFEKKAETKEFLSELKSKEGEDIQKQVEWFIDTVYSILNGDTNNDFYVIAKETGILDHSVKSLLTEVDNFKKFMISTGYVKTYPVLFTELSKLETLLNTYLKHYGNTKISELTGKIEEIEEILQRSKKPKKEEIEEVEIELKPVKLVRKPTLEGYIKRSRTVEFNVEQLTESQIEEIAHDINTIIDKSLKCPLEVRYNMLKEISPLVEKLVNSGNFEQIPELWYALWRYKSVILPLSVFAKERNNYAYLSKVKCPIEVSYA